MLNCCYQQMVIIFVQRVGKLEKPVLKMKKSKISKKKKRGHLQIFTILYFYASIQIGLIRIYHEFYKSNRNIWVYSFDMTYFEMLVC